MLTRIQNAFRRQRVIFDRNNSYQHIWRFWHNGLKEHILPLLLLFLLFLFLLLLFFFLLFLLLFFLFLLFLLLLFLILFFSLLLFLQKDEWTNEEKKEERGFS